MRNLLVYYIAILLPLGILLLMYAEGAIGSAVFFLLFVAYLLIYRTWTDGTRLSSKGIITKEERWKMMLPGMHMKHFTELYLK